jgi:hypothetical protein
MKIRKKAIFGIGKPTEAIGSPGQHTDDNARAIARPSLAAAPREIEAIPLVCESQLWTRSSHAVATLSSGGNAAGRDDAQPRGCLPRDDGQKQRECSTAAHLW